VAIHKGGRRTLKKKNNIPIRNKLAEKSRIYGQLKKFLFLVTAAILFGSAVSEEKI
jgi:hypothetical protein